jgi:glycosyltransferase involved in cell wall biosynthesis
MMSGAAEKPSESKRVLVVTTHPIQYMAPWYRSIAVRSDIDLLVTFLRELDATNQGVGFGRAFTWDVPLRDGYESEVLGVGASLIDLPSVIFRMTRTLRRVRPDVVMITGWNEAALVAIIALSFLLRIPVLLRGESNDVRKRSWRARIFHRTLLAMTFAVVSIGKGNRNFYASYGFPSSATFPGVYFVENERMLAMASANADESSTLRLLDGASTEDVVFSFCGKHVAFKRPDWLVEAAGLLVKDGLPIVLRFAGSGDMTDALKTRCRELGVRAHFTGFLNQTEMWRAYVGADVFVLPSTNRETWGLVVNEAMLFGLPVIASNEVGCVPDLVIEDQTGWAFTGGVEALADCMKNAVQKLSRLSAMGRHASEHVSSNYSMDVATSGLLEAIRFVTR